MAGKSRQRAQTTMSSPARVHLQTVDVDEVEKQTKWQGLRIQLARRGNRAWVRIVPTKGWHCTGSVTWDRPGTSEVYFERKNGRR
jgi:hypothetical protein